MPAKPDSSPEKLKLSGTALGAFELFQKLTLEEREKLARSFTMKRYKKNQYVISTAQSSDEVYFVLSGRVQACAFSENGKQIHFEELIAGMMFGELSAIDKSERSSDCICLSESTIAVVESSEFIRIIENYPSVNAALLQRLVALVRRHMRKVYEFSSFPVNQRVRLELLRMASASTGTDGEILLDKVPTHAEIASRISTHREAVTRELKSLESDGVITWRPGKYIIHDASRLAIHKSG